MIARLEQSQTLSLVDDAVLYQYAQLFAEAEGITGDRVEGRRLLKQLSRATSTLSGAELVAAIAEVTKLQQMASKQTMQLRQMRMALRQYLVEFGMTPSARSRVKTVGRASSGEPGVSALDRFINRSRR